MVDLVADPNFAHALLDKVTKIHIGMWQNFLDVVGGYVDVVETADDLGTQNSLLISPRLYRKMIKPYHAALNAAIREKTGAKIFFHSCGAVMPRIEDLIETGVDILNPIQPLSGLMEPDELQKRFGDRLIFHGGLDVQNLLPEGDLEQVKRHVRKYYESLGWERYIMAPTNTILPGTPPENIVAAFKEAKLSGLV
ncbi:MAG: hypothetical protein EHM41_18560 [Chloroflexi bacterium]|nr:MAG: hypothetical protein EHM41_18560 [Chloroflexota bacterium]